MVSAHYFFLSILTALASAKGACRCGDAAFLSIQRTNIPTPQQIKPCAAYKLLDARGTGEPEGVSLMFQIAIERLLANNTEATYQPIAYPAGYLQNTTSGVQNAVDIINYGIQDCPEQKYFLFGYSQGATVMQEALNKLDELAAANMESLVLVGNPYRTPGRKSNVDEHGNADNRTVYGLFVEQENKNGSSDFPMYSGAFDQSGKVADICLEDDIVCASDPECDCQLASDHLSYGLMESVQDLIFEHVVARF